MRIQWLTRALSLLFSLVLCTSVAMPAPIPAAFLANQPTLAKLQYSSAPPTNRRFVTPVVSRATRNPIQLENQRPGSSGWRLGPQVADDVNQQIKGYASAVSVNQGQSITFYVTVNPVQAYVIDIYRMGWYGGLGGRFITRIGPLAGVSQPPCPVAMSTGMVECHWAAPAAATLTVPTTWTSGIYLAHLINAQGYENYSMFVVRNDAQPADFLYQQPVNTYQAYNDYPADGVSGKSLYPYNSFGLATTLGTLQAVKVSFDRPYTAAGDGGFTGPASYEGYFVHWLERMGYNVTYATDLDVHAHSALLQKYKGVLVGGHSEYWSKAMYSAASKARDAGVNLGFFGANDVYWQVRFEPSSRGVANRVMVCYKTAVQYDPAPPDQKTTNWDLVGQPEQALLGVEYGLANTLVHVRPYIVTDSASWVFKGTGFKNGTRVPGLVGNEIDAKQAHAPLPPHRAYEILSSSPFISTAPNLRENANSSIYQAPSGAWVFDAGTLGWNWALGRPGYVSPGIQQATKNILARFMEKAPARPVVMVSAKG